MFVMAVVFIRAVFSVESSRQLGSWPVFYVVEVLPWIFQIAGVFVGVLNGAGDLCGLLLMVVLAVVFGGSY